MRERERESARGVEVRRRDGRGGRGGIGLSLWWMAKGLREVERLKEVYRYRRLSLRIDVPWSKPLSRVLA